MMAAMEMTGNPSSIHLEGRSARKVIDDAREKLAFWFGALPQMITFTSGGTEANNLAIRGVGAERIVISAVEHPSVMVAAKASGKTVDIVPVDAQGRIDLAALEKSVHGANVLVSVMQANNETGVIQPIADVVRIVKSKGALVHVDAVQAVGKCPVNFGLMGCDLLTVGAHKVGGPVGIGALITRDGVVLDPLLHGGGQELRRRAGSENVPAIAGFAALADEAPVQTNALVGRLETALSDVLVFGDEAERLTNTICFAMPSMRAETLLMGFDLDGVAVSSGSACSSGKVGRSHVLEAMGVAPDIAGSAIRVSLGWTTTEAEIDMFISVWTKLLARHRARKAA